MSPRYNGLLRDTWWLWCVLVIGGIILGGLVHKIFFVSLPISAFAFFYFGIMRYDNEGNPKEGL